MSLSLHEHLFNLNADVKKDWLRRVGAWDKALTCKAHFVAAIENHLRDQLGAFAELLTEPERNLLAESAHQGRLIGAREFEAKFGAPCPMPTGYREFGEKASLLIPLISRPRYAQEGEPELAAELIEPLRRLFPKPETPPPRTLPGLPKSWPPESERSERDKIRPIRVHESERLAPAELGRVLRLIQGGRLQVAASTRRPTEATVRLVGDALVAPDFLLEPPPKESDQWTETAGPIRAHAWPVLVQQCGWARPHGGTLKLTAEGLAMLRGFSAEAFRAGVNRFLSDGEFDELHRINHLRGQTGKARRWISDPGSRKTTLGEVMDVLPIGEWLAYGEARRLIEASGENWDVVKENAGVLYFCEQRYGTIYDSNGINSQFLRALFLESFATLGLMDVGYVYPQSLWPDLGETWGADDMSFCGRYDGLLYVRINPLGAYGLEIAGDYEFHPPAMAKLFQVKPNLEIHLTTGLLDPVDRAGLEQLAAEVDEQVWRLDTDRILSHVEAGGALGELRQFLENNNAGALPDGVRDFMDSLGRRSRALRRTRDAVLLEWEDEGIARHLAADIATGELCSYAGGNRVVVTNDRFGAFRRAVKRMGYVVPAKT